MVYLLSVLLFNVVTYYDWQSLPSPGIRNHDHAVVYDPVNDLFFVLGGDSTGYETNMDICLAFDPKTNTWDTLEPMPTKKARHRASYRNGFIHVVCGIDNGIKFNRHEVYDISDDSWDTAASAPLKVTSPCLVTWRDSLVYLIGGYDVSHDARTDVYVYDAASDTWDSATFLPRRLHCGRARVKGDSIFIIGGADGSSIYSNILLGEINPADPTDIDWSWGVSFPMAYNGDEGLAIKNNKAYTIGGSFDDGTNEVWEYDIQNETWASLPDYPTSIIVRSDFAERRDGPDSSGVVYCFMSDTTPVSMRTPTDECYRLINISAENDAGMLSINSPVSDTIIGTFVQVNGTVKNYGTDTFSFESGVNIYDPDLLIAFTQTIQVDSLPPLDTLNIDFGSFQLTKGGTYTVEMFTYSLTDEYSSNDTLTTTFKSSDCYWQSLPSPGIRNHDHAVVYDPVDDLFFILGGDSTGNETNMDICLEFDPKTNTWDTRESMPTKRARLCAAYRNGFIHVLCGKDDYGNLITTHEVYDIELNTWSTKAAAPRALSVPSVVTWRDSLVYLIGGYDVSHDARTEVYLYDAVTNSWDSATFLPREFFDGGAAIQGDSIFIIGGSDGSSIYSNILLGEINPADPTEITWSWGESYPMAYNGSNGLAIKDNKVYMIGGNFGDCINEVWEYDIQNGTWDSLPDYPTSVIIRGDFAARRDGPDSSGIVYCFMGDTTPAYLRTPTDECYRLIRTSSPSGIKKEESPRNNSISLNSTISTDRITINCNITKRCDLKIYMYDVLGRQVFSYLDKNISTGSHQLNLQTNLTNGIYFIRIEADTSVTSEKILLIR